MSNIVEKFNKGINELFKYFSAFNFNVENASHLSRFFLQFSIYKIELIKYEYDKNNLANLSKEIKNFIDLINDLRRFSDEVHLKIIKDLDNIIIRGGCDNPAFYQKHKMMLKKWIAKKTPKDKIIAEIASWLNLKPTDAVVATMQILIKDSKKLVNFVAEVYGYKHYFNKMINIFYRETLTNFISYYTDYRNFYIDGSHFSERIKIGDDVEIKIKDPFIDISLQFKKCEFSQLEPLIKKILNAITAIDYKAVEILLKNNKVEKGILTPGGDPFARKKAKKNILETLKKCKLSCIETKPIEVFVEYKESLENILKTVSDFIKIEEEAYTQIEEIKSIYHKQAKQVELLNNALILGDIRDIFIYVAAAKNALNKEHWEKFLNIKWSNLEGKELSKFLEKLI